MQASEVQMSTVARLRYLILAGVCSLGASTALMAQSAEAPPWSGLLPDERGTLWAPGIGGNGIPARTTICDRLQPQVPPHDDTARIQRAIDTCPIDQVVQLEAGTFHVTDGNYLLLNKGLSLRGRGPGQTVLARPDGAKPFQRAGGRKPAPLVVIGPHRYAPAPDAAGYVSINLVGDAIKGERTVRVSSTKGFSPGEVVLLDEASNASWQKDPQGRGLIWAAPDWRVVWNKRQPAVRNVDDFAPDAFPTTPGSAGAWFSRQDRPTAEIKEIAAVSDMEITFTTPIHITYRTTHAAQLSRYGSSHVRDAGVEDLTLIGGDDGNLRFNMAALCWARNVESTVWLGEGFAIDKSFRIELREFYVHDGAWVQPGGGGYAISLAHGSSEVLIENGISVRANKVMVSRSAGAGSVVGYNYMDMGYINNNGAWIEAGLNASHMVGSHHVLFEGNYGHNAESDHTHGNSIYLTFFRNQLRGMRAPFANQAGGRVDDAMQSGNGPKRAVGLQAYSYWMSFLGNVLGDPERTNGWLYEARFAGRRPGIWLLGWDGVTPYPTDVRVAETALRHGNFDYVTKTVRWDPRVASQRLPPSLYLVQKPSFFDAGRGYVWPWVNPDGAAKVHTLPAKARYDAGTPFTQP